MATNINQIFHLPRFWQYARAHFSEKKCAYFWHFVIISMLYYPASKLLYSNTFLANRLHILLYFIGLFFTGGVFTLRYFAGLSKNPSAITLLMQPASCFEKWLLAIVTILLAYPVCYSLCFTLMTAIEFGGEHPLVTELWLPLFGVYNPQLHALNENIAYWVMYAFIMGYALATTIQFKRFPIIKSISLGFALFLVCLWMQITIQPDGTVIGFFFAGNRIEGISVWLVGIIVWVIPPVLLWAASFRALKERDLS